MPALSVIAPPHRRECMETLSERIRRLQAEARDLAREHIAALEAALDEVERIAAEIANGGEAYPPGVRDIAMRLAEESHLKAQSLEALAARSK
ncbi:MAG TPA: hypothetical protein VEA79_14180 [Phenylobacterium sp.]|nr:hypothetical protein [Phenylobacterium sp.]